MKNPLFSNQTTNQPGGRSWWYPRRKKRKGKRKKEGLTLAGGRCTRKFSESGTKEHDRRDLFGGKKEGGKESI